MGAAHRRAGAGRRRDARGLRGIELPVARLSDIALLKLYAAATDDVEDAELFLRHPSAGAVIDEVSAEIGRLPRDCRERWARLEPRWRALIAR